MQTDVLFPLSNLTLFQLFITIVVTTTTTTSIITIVVVITTFVFLEDLYCISWTNLNSLVFTIRQLVGRQKAHSYTFTDPTFGFNLPHHLDMVYVVLDDVVSYTQWWKFKLAEVTAWESNH